MLDLGLGADFDFAIATDVNLTPQGLILQPLELRDTTTSVSTQGFIASVSPTPVANLQGSATYSSSAASEFIGSGSAGDVTNLVAGMDVDFDTGAISAGALQVQVADSQVWNLGFAGSVHQGVVDLNMTHGTLLESGAIVSDSIQADLGGVFTGVGGEAFVGGFDLLDQINELNQVNGLYTIER